MIVHPDIAALRSDPVSQRRIAARMQQAQREWRNGHAAEKVAAELALFDAGCGIDACPALTQILSDLPKAIEFAGVWVNALLGALRKEPLGEVPFRYRTSSGVADIQILQTGRSAVNLVVYERRDDANGDCPQTAMFTDCDSNEVVLSGSATATLHTRDKTAQGAAKLDTEKLRLTAGDRIALHGQRQARRIVSVDGFMALLRVSRTPDHPKPSHEYRLSDGALVHRISGNKAASQRLMAVSVLGALDALEDGDTPTRGAIQKTALDKTEDMDVRWEAVRQTLALDTRQGLDLLKICADDHSDVLAEPARKLRAQLALEEPA